MTHRRSRTPSRLPNLSASQKEKINNEKMEGTFPSFHKILDYVYLGDEEAVGHIENFAIKYPQQNGNKLTIKHFVCLFLRKFASLENKHTHKSTYKQNRKRKKGRETTIIIKRRY